MNLTFIRTDYGGAEGVGENGAVLFTISPLTARDANFVCLRSDLPGVRSDIKVEGPGKYDKETFAKAMETAARALKVWASRQPGVDLDVNIVDNT